MGGHKFHGDMARLDNPRRKEILPVEPVIEVLGGIKDGLAVADLGCGTGYLSVPLAKHLDGHGTVYAVDINPKALEVLKEKAAGIDNILALQSEENKFPIESRTIDVSFMVAVFHELDDPSSFLMEIRRISKPFHQIVVVDWSDVQGEMGPPMSERIPEKDVIKFFKDRGCAFKKKFAPSRYMYGLVFSV
ncbi:MAG: hypothetical protein AUK32_01120 [Candidatus Aquicultor secundus]|nr:class I SAM-dependent methyltransferase [Candidatus Aquicultor secundus]NCO66376.1 class I SAM-dependent methyltransferase [Solirubrobacter sp.]OIO88581.1 MAG: hypothetical protein AUK32_01120 [Candidatus Aquicultor secundus]PIU26949.1 MAG: SAM-dependent methyltransferase [Candidatus Aquicultor secundus]PIX51386.1 MAG: SAM-dependent methyltransferase [Candidatus Aquicultor secundus]